MLSAKRLPFMLCLRDELQNYYGRKRIRNFSAVNFAKRNDYFLWITLPLAKQIQSVSLKKILPFSNYRERRTFFREFSRVKHSSLPRQTVAFFNWKCLERKHVKFWQLDSLCVSGHETQVSKTFASTFYVSSMNVDSKWRLYISGKCWDSDLRFFFCFFFYWITFFYRHLHKTNINLLTITYGYIDTTTFTNLLTSTLLR